MPTHKVVSYEHLQPIERKLGFPVGFILGRIIRPFIQGLAVCVMVAMPLAVLAVGVWALVKLLS